LSKGPARVVQVPMPGPTTAQQDGSSGQARLSALTKRPLPPPPPPAPAPRPEAVMATAPRLEAPNHVALADTSHRSSSRPASAVPPTSATYAAQYLRSTAAAVLQGQGVDSTRKEQYLSGASRLGESPNGLGLCVCLTAAVGFLQRKSFCPSLA
jgi:hypothetical protein